MFVVRKSLENLVGAQIVFGHGNQSGSHAQLTDKIVVDTNLSQRTIAESYDEAIIPFEVNKSIVYIGRNDLFFSFVYLATDIKLRERYVNFENKVRFGRILEDLDTMAGNRNRKQMSKNQNFCRFFLLFSSHCV